MRIVNEASLAWEEARTSLHYSIFESKLVKLVDYEKD
jgi:Zn-dependent M32 family carboxypeptidase